MCVCVFIKESVDEKLVEKRNDGYCRSSRFSSQYFLKQQRPRKNYRHLLLQLYKSIVLALFRFFFILFIFSPVLLLLFFTFPGLKTKKTKKGVGCRRNEYNEKERGNVRMRKKKENPEFSINYQLCGLFCTFPLTLGLIVGRAAYGFCWLHLMHIKTCKKTLGRVQMCSNSLHLLLVLLALDKIQPPLFWVILHHCRQPRWAFYEPCPPEEDESSHITEKPQRRAEHDCCFRIQTACRGEIGESPFEIASSSMLLNVTGSRRSLAAPNFVRSHPTIVMAFILFSPCRAIASGARCIYFHFLGKMLKQQVDDRFSCAS